MEAQMKKYEIAIIGGGASGLFAAICAAMYLEELGGRKEAESIILLEKNDRVGKKLLITGNGRCNITNSGAGMSSYNGSGAGIAGELMNSCTPEKMLEVFHRIGIDCRREEEGRIYPESGQASSVLELMRMYLSAEKIEQRCGFVVKNIRKQKKEYILEGEKENIYAYQVILATGGLAAPSTGADGSGYGLAAQFGHKRTPTFPALVQMKTEAARVRALKGNKCRAKVSVDADGRIQAEESGEVLFTEYGLSGICIFQLSRLVSEFFRLGTVHGKKAKKVTARLDLFPHLSSAEMRRYLDERKKNLLSFPLESFFYGVLPKQIGQELLKSTVPEPFKRLVKSLETKEIESLAQKAKCWEFPLTGTMSWQQAQVTAGGLDVMEFDNHTLESKKSDGLYACGELLDVDGQCGGFNLQWAWASGYTAGRAAVERMYRKKRG